MIYAGRGLYGIDGHPGLWYCRSNPRDPRSESVMARGPMGEAMFYRAVAAEEQLRKALGDAAYEQQ
jgi:hypothetical protein